MRRRDRPRSGRRAGSRPAAGQTGLAATRVHGTVCFTGMVSNEWTVPDPIGYLPNVVRPTGHGGDSADLPADAHADMEHNRVVGKRVVLI